MLAVAIITRRGLARMQPARSTPWFSSKPRCLLTINNFFFAAVLVPRVILILSALLRLAIQASHLTLATGISSVMALDFNAMSFKNKNLLSSKKLLLSKWTAVEPSKKRKHFLVRKIIAPTLPDAPIEYVEIEAVFDGWVKIIPWRQLQDGAIWLQGWK